MTKKDFAKYAGGFLLGSVGLSVLKSGVAQKVYTAVTAGVFIAKDYVLEEAEKFHATALDIADDAKEMTEKYYEEKDQKFDQGLDAEEADFAEVIE
jgi:hypothetical protein